MSGCGDGLRLGKPDRVKMRGNADVAKLADAQVSGSCGRPWGFESLHPHHKRAGAFLRPCPYVIQTHEGARRGRRSRERSVCGHFAKARTNRPRSLCILPNGFIIRYPFVFQIGFQIVAEKSVHLPEQTKIVIIDGAELFLPHFGHLSPSQAMLQRSQKFIMRLCKIGIYSSIVSVLKSQ